MTCTRVVTFTVGALLAVDVLAGPSAADLAGQKDRQEQIKADTDCLVRRVETMIRVLEYNRLDSSAQKKLLAHVADTLSGLSRAQMTRLIAALEAAGKAKGAARSISLEEAQARHEQIVLALKGLRRTSSTPSRRWSRPPTAWRSWPATRWTCTCRTPSWSTRRRPAARPARATRSGPASSASRASRCSCGATCPPYWINYAH
jgi:hypothetical protein